MNKLSSIELDNLAINIQKYALLAMRNDNIVYKASRQWNNSIWIHARFLNKSREEKRNLEIQYESIRKIIPYNNIRSYICDKKQNKDKRTGKINRFYKFDLH